MTQNNEIDFLKSQNKLISQSSISLNSLEQSNPKDELLKSDMMKKLSLKEKWLNEQAAAAILSKPVPMEVDDKVAGDKKKDEKKSFFTGILSSVKHLIKNDKDKPDKNKSTSPPSGESLDLDKLIENETTDVDNFDELVVESDKPAPGCVRKGIKAFLQKQKSDEIREGADEILNEIKDGNDRMAKQMRDMEQKRFSDNMKAIKSSVVDSKVASMKEVNLSKYFPAQQEKKPPAVAKNRDVKALKDVNLLKYFPPTSPTPGKKTSGSPNGQSATSSATASPLVPRKNLNEIDLANYFPGTPTLSRKISTSTPPSSPLTENAPLSFERRFSVTNYIPPPPPPPVAKKNILALQTVKKRQPVKENIDTTAQNKKETAKKKPKDFNMFDQLLDGAIDLKEIEDKRDKNVDSFDALTDDVKHEKSPSKEYAKNLIGESDKIKSSSSDKTKSKKREIPPINAEQKRPSPVKEENVQDTKAIKKPKRKSPKKVVKDGILDKLSLDPAIFQNLTSEYQRLLVELERSSKSPETEDSDQKIETATPKIIDDASPNLKLDFKRKSPQRCEDRKKFKEELEDDKKIVQLTDVKVEIEEDSVVARLEKKYRRGSLQNNEAAAPVQEKLPETPTTPNDDVQTSSVIERLEKKLKQKREAENAPSSYDVPDADREVIKESTKLNSVSLVKDQVQKQEINISELLSLKAEKSRDNPKAAEVNCFKTLLSLPKENVHDIFSEFELTEKETEKALKEFQESFELLSKNDIDEDSVNIDILESVSSTLKKHDLKSIHDQTKQIQPEVVKRNLIDDQQQQLESKNQSKANLENNTKQKRKSLQMDLAEIDFNISERPLNLDQLFPRRTSIGETPDSPKSLNSNDETKIASAKDSAYSGSRRSSANEIDEVIAQDKPEPKTAISASYINVLKEISSGLIGFDDEPLLLMESPIKLEPKKAQLSTEPLKSKENVKHNHTKVLQDISNNLIGADLPDIHTQEKNYSQIIPPFVRDQAMKKAPSANNLDVPNYDFDPDVDEVIEVKIPIPPPRRHKSTESNDITEPSLKTKRFLPTSKSFDYDTVSGRTSKNSTEYYDHYYPTVATSRRVDKYDPLVQKESFDVGARTRIRQRAIDDLMVKPTKSRFYEADDVPTRRVDSFRERSVPSDARVLLERSHMLHERKENFMRDQMNESNNPYIREMMKQDVDNPIDISDIKFIRNHPSAPLPTSSHFSSYQRPTSSYVPSTRTTNSYTKPSTSSYTPVTTSYSRSSGANPVSSYKSSVPSSSSLGYLNPSSSTASHILTKSHTLSPHSSHTPTYTPRTRPITSLSDAHTTSSSRMMTQSRPTTYSQKKSSGSSRDACVIS